MDPIVQGLLCSRFGQEKDVKTLSSLACVDKSFFRQATVEFAEIATTDEMQTRCVQLFKLLISMNLRHGHTPDLLARIERCSDSDRAHRILDIFVALVKEEQGFELATEVAKLRFVKHATREKALELFTTLIGKKQAFKEAIGAALKANSGYFSTKLFLALVKQDQAFQEATGFAKLACSHSDHIVQYNGYALFTELVKKGQAFREAIDIARHGWSTALSKPHALELFKALIVQGQAFQEATALVKEAFKRGRLEEALLQALFDKDQAYQEATALAKEAVVHEDAAVRSRGMDLFAMLVTKGRAYQEAIAVAKEALAHEDATEGIEFALMLLGTGQESEKYSEKLNQVIQGAEAPDNQAVVNTLIELLSEMHLGVN